jgi:hypothetical protein
MPPEIWVALLLGLREEWGFWRLDNFGSEDIFDGLSDR